MRVELPCLALLILWDSLMAARARGEENTLPPVNARVLKFVEGRIDKQVADGDCWQLADMALAAAGARRPGRSGSGVYVFGRLLKPDEPVLPGDLVQFSGARFASRQGTRYDMPRHTAIVAAVDGTALEIMHQNWNGTRRVTRLRLDLADLRAGKVSLFRPHSARKRGAEKGTGYFSVEGWRRLQRIYPVPNGTSRISNTLLPAAFGRRDAAALAADTASVGVCGRGVQCGRDGR